MYKPKETVYKRLEPGEIIVFLHRGNLYDEICRMEIVACGDDNVSNYLRDKDKEYMHDIEDDCTFFVLKLRSEIKTLNKSDLEFLNNEPINTFDPEECISPWASNQLDKLLKL